MININNNTFIFLWYFCLIVIIGCKPTQHVSHNQVIKAAKEVWVSPDRKGFTYLKNGQEYKTRRDLKGTISQEVTDSLFSLLPEGEGLETPKVLLFNYYPAKTPSNSSGSCDGACLKNKYKQAERRINKLENTAVYYLNRPGADLGKYAEITDWADDTYYLMERYFVPHPQLGNSFVVLCRNGDYEAYLGEFSQSYLLETFSRVYVDCSEAGASNHEK